jgi:hypothetical protein
MKIRLHSIPIIALIILFSLPSAPLRSAQAQPTSVLTNRYNNGRTGANLNETVLNLANVNRDQFGRLFTRQVLGHIYAQPLYVPDVEIPNKGIHNVVYVATMHNLVYAFDADDPTLSDPLWQAYLGIPFTQNVLSDIAGGEVGVLSTPVIDPDTQTIYLVARNWEDNRAVYKLHALDITTGFPRFGSPVNITLTVSGTGANNVNGIVSLDAYNQLQRTGLLLVNGNVYFGFGSNNDTGLWYGWMAGYDAATLELSGVINFTANGWSGGIWMSGTGISSDGTYLYLATANGKYTVDEGGTDFSQSILKLEHTGDTFTVLDYYTPTQVDELNNTDLGLGSTGAVLFPNSDIIVAGSKDGNLYVVDRNQLGHFDPDADQNLQIFSTGVGIMYCTPVVWENGPGNVPTLYSWNIADVLKAFTLDTSTRQFNPQPSSSSALLSVGMPVGSMVLSANGTDPNTGIIWATYAPSADVANYDGILVALNATDLNQRLWHSEMVHDRDTMGLLAKFSPPTVANGKVYVATFSDQLSVYGLLGG